MVGPRSWGFAGEDAMAAGTSRAASIFRGGSALT